MNLKFWEKKPKYFGITASIRKLVEDLISLGHEGDIVITVPPATYAKISAETMAHNRYYPEVIPYDRRSELVMYCPGGNIKIRMDYES